MQSKLLGAMNPSVRSAALQNPSSHIASLSPLLMTWTEVPLDIRSGYDHCSMNKAGKEEGG